MSEYEELKVEEPDDRALPKNPDVCVEAEVAAKQFLNAFQFCHDSFVKAE